LLLIQRACPAVSPENLDNSFDDLDVDSLGMLTLRTKLEDALGIKVNDETWSSVDRRWSLETSGRIFAPDAVTAGGLSEMFSRPALSSLGGGGGEDALRHASTSLFAS
jgi:acyl carrier protein